MPNNPEDEVVKSALSAASKALRVPVDEVWEERPVSPSMFFEKFLNEPCYPEQQRFVDAILGTKAEEWDDQYTEGIGLAGKGCITEDTAILDAESGNLCTVGNLYRENKTIKVHSWDGKNIVIKQASVPFLKGNAPIYEITTSQGICKITGEHVFFTKDGWKKAKDLKIGDGIASPKKLEISFRN